MPFPLETERLIIRPFELDDAESYFLIDGDPEVMARIPGGPSPSIDKTRERLERWRKYHDETGFSQWVLIDKRTNEIIGNCGLIPVEGKGPGIEVTYDIGRKFWNMGFATEAARECVRFGFEELGLELILAMTYPDHLASRRVMEKIGMNYSRDGTYYDRELIVYTITKAAYQTHQRNPKNAS